PPVATPQGLLPTVCRRPPVANPLGATDCGFDARRKAACGAEASPARAVARMGGRQQRQRLQGWPPLGRATTGGQVQRRHLHRAAAAAA
ncbi:hypothetical protein GW17_00056769, partial [Ensete ventricosum]